MPFIDGHFKDGTPMSSHDAEMIARAFGYAGAASMNQAGQTASAKRRAVISEALEYAKAAAA